MKKFIAIALVALCGVFAAQAQVEKGGLAIGGNVVYGDFIESMGLGARVQYGILDNLRTELGFNYYFEHNDVNMYDINLNFHYLLGLWEQKLYVYPIVGLNFSHAGVDGFDGVNKLGANLGAGLEYELTERVGVNLEYRHSFVKDPLDQNVIGLGFNYKF